MIIWSVMPEEAIFAPAEALSKKRVIAYLGRRVQIIPQQKGQSKIVGIISSNPGDYLDSQIAPGTIINNI